MPRKPKRYPLPLYERTLKRWISATFSFILTTCAS
jgi:hypothetical protein